MAFTCAGLALPLVAAIALPPRGVPLLPALAGRIAWCYLSLIRQCLKVPGPGGTMKRTASRWLQACAAVAVVAGLSVVAAAPSGAVPSAMSRIDPQRSASGFQTASTSMPIDKRQLTRSGCLQGAKRPMATLLSRRHRRAIEARQHDTTALPWT